MESDSSKQPAPGALALVQAFVNTLDVEAQQDELTDPDTLRSWLAERGLVERDTVLGKTDLQRTREVREAMRALMLANNGAEIDGHSLAALNRVAEHAPLVVCFDADGRVPNRHTTDNHTADVDHSAGHGAHLEPVASGGDGALARLLAIVYTAMIEGTWSRLKVCRSDTCQWAFYDQSKNRSGAWCSMAVCGSRVKARTYRQRRRQDAPTTHQH